MKLYCVSVLLTDIYILMESHEELESQALLDYDNPPLSYNSANKYICDICIYYLHPLKENVTV